jgi:hypothetical protein
MMIFLGVVHGMEIFLYFYEVNLYLCEGGIDFNSSDPRCKNMSELLLHHNTSWLFEFYYPVVQFEPTNMDNPISVIYRSYFLSFKYLCE